MRWGRPRTATHAEVERVLALAARGVSRRKIAESVFGDARYRGRVERIVGGEAFPLPRPDEADATARARREGFNEPSELPSTRELLERHRRRLAEMELPPLKEIELLLKLERQVEAMEAVALARALTREA